MFYQVIYQLPDKAVTRHDKAVDYVRLTNSLCNLLGISVHWDVLGSEEMSPDYS